MADEILIGFDAREPREHDPRWDSDRREDFLLRSDVVRPLSVGVFTWPSLFDTGQGHTLTAGERSRLGFAGIGVPDWIGAKAGLWESLYRMKGYLDEHGADPAGAECIAVGWVSRLGFRDSGNVGPYAEPTEPAKPQRGWHLLGYDVADGSLISGVTECAYTPDEKESLRRRWGSALNEYHLFRDQAAAFDFVEVSNMRVADHAPFYVYTLYRIP